MRLTMTFAAERRRRKAAEAQVVRLQAQLDAITAKASSWVPAFPAGQSMAQLFKQADTTAENLVVEHNLISQVIDVSPNIVYVEDANGRCVLANKSCVQLLSQQVDERLIYPTADSKSSPNLRSADETASFEEYYRLANGQEIWYHTTQIPLVHNENSRYLITFSSNITELKQAQQLAEESMRTRDMFLANMSHEIRTPLHGVMGIAELLKKESLSDEQADYVEMIQTSTENLLVVINDILDFAKIESGNIRLETIPFDIHKIVHEAARSLSFKVSEKGLILRILGLEDELPLALGDPFRLYQVLVNLLSNAIKFTPHGIITIVVDASKRDNERLPVTFQVIDTGIGIDAENASLIFNSFQQANSSIPRLYGGTGLGLTICKNLVELQNGEIGVSSEPGRGSCFYFTIPYDVSEEPAPRTPAVVLQPDLLQGLSVLLAEDNNINQLIAVSMLGQWKVKVDIAQNGEEALAKAMRQQYDIILMDVHMPQLDGIEATARLRAQNGPNQYTPIIATTADAIQIGAGSCASLGFTSYLIKPYHELALYKILGQISQRAPAEHLTTLPAVAPTASATQGRYYDFSMFGKLANDLAFIHKLLTMFVDRVPSQVRALQEAIEQEDWATVISETHILKTTFGSLHIEPETAYLKRIGELAKVPAPKMQFQPLIAEVSKATILYSEIFLKDLSLASTENSAKA